jgi:hypothetical protein
VLEKKGQEGFTGARNGRVREVRGRPGRQWTGGGARSEEGGRRGTMRMVVATGGGDRRLGRR